MSAILESPQKALEALSRARPVLESPQKALEALLGPLREPGPVVRDEAAAHARLTATDVRIGRGEGAAALRAIDRADRTVSLVNGIGLLTRLSRTMHTLAIPHTELALFMGLLRYCGVLPKEQEYTLVEQEVLHKCAFIARAFGLDLGYEWHLHEYGTFSSFLAADHVELIEGRMQVDIGAIVDLAAAPGFPKLAEDAQDGAPLLSADFEIGRFISLVSGRDIEWLSVASTIVYEKGSCPDELLPAYVSRINADCDERMARRVMGEIRSSRPPAWGAMRGA